MSLEKAVAAGRWLRQRAENFLVAILSLMFATFILQIFFRYVINQPLGWSEEVIVTTWLWTVLWGAAFVLRESEEIRFDIIYSNVSQRVRRIFTVITGVIAVFFYAVSLPATYSYVSFMKVERSAYLHVPINWMYSVFVIFALACIGRYAWLAYNALRGGKPPDAEPPKAAD